MKNLDIRDYAKEKGVCLWEVSERLGYAHETAFSRVLRHELTEDKKQKIRAIIDELSGSNYEGYEERVFRHMEVMNDSQKQHLLACAEHILLNESEE